MTEKSSLLASLCIVVLVTAVPASADTIADSNQIAEKERKARRAGELEALRREFDSWSRDELLGEILDLRDEVDEMSVDVDRLSEELDPPRKEP